jgi:PAS domain S-box-containing protein
MCANAHAGLALLDRDLRCVQINGHLADIDGLPAEAHLGRTPRDFIPDLADAVEPSLRHVLETGEPIIDQEVSGETGAEPGVRRHWLASFQPVRDGSGSVVGVSAAVLEITLRKHAEAAQEERRRRLRLFIDRAPAAIAMLDTEMRYVAASRRYLADFRLDAVGPDDLAGQRHCEVFPDSPPRWRDVSRVLAGEAVSAEEDPFPRAGGRVDWVRWEAVPWRQDDGAVGGIRTARSPRSCRRRAVRPTWRRPCRRISRPSAAWVMMTSSALMALNFGCGSTGMPRPLSRTVSQLSGASETSMKPACPATASSIELSRISAARWCSAASAVPPTYMPGRRRTGSSPSSTSMSLAE